MPVLKTDSIQHIRKKSGIYVLVNNNNPLYIGYSMDIYIRLLEHSFNKRKFDIFGYYELVGFNRKETQLIEILMIKRYTPKENKMIVKKTKGFYMKYKHFMECDYDYYYDYAGRIVGNMDEIIL